MPHHIGLITNTTGPSSMASRNFCDRLYALLTGIGYPTSLSKGTLVGNGSLPYYVMGTATTINETWTVTCTSASTDGGTFSVVGSVTGATANAVVGQHYDNGKIKFAISDGTVDYAVGDYFQVAMSAPFSTDAATTWETMRWWPGKDTMSNAERECLLKGKGFSGTEEIYIGFYDYYSAGNDYYNIAVGVAAGYSPGNTWVTQPAMIRNAVCAHNITIEYWVTWNAQRVAFVLKVGGAIYQSAYLGKFFPYCPPTQYPYPVANIAMLDDAAALRFSSTDSSYSMGYRGNNSRCNVRSPGGVWEAPSTYPWIQEELSYSNTESSSYQQLRDTNGYYPLTPIMLLGSSGIYGELDGVYHVSGFNNVVENTVTAGGKTHVCFGDKGLTGFVDFFAMRLD